MIEVQILIPTADNANAPFTDAHHSELDEFLAIEFGGFTRLPALAAGGWHDASGAYYPDQHLIYAVALKSITEGGRVATLAEFVKAHYSQINVYVRYLTLAEIL